MLEKLVKALFRRGFEQKSDSEPEEQPMERTFDSYYQRTLRLKTEILNGNGIKENICAAFEQTYLGKKESKSVVFLGQGDTHIVLHVGEVVDPQNLRPVHLAVRLWHYNDNPYDMGIRSRLLISSLYAFQNAFVYGDNPPYFVGVVSWEGPKERFEERVLGFILEDVSENNRFRLVPDGGHKFFLREESRGRRTRFFLDPEFEYLDGDVTSRYLSDEARIDLN